MSLSLYLDSAQEEESEIAFRDPKKHELDGLMSDLELAADCMGKSVPTVCLPKKGFLVEPLTQEQRMFIEKNLGPVYAQTNVMHQKELLDIPIKECGDKMIAVKSTMERAKIDVEYSKKPFHDACREYAQKQRIWYVREQVAYKLVSTFLVFNKINICPQYEDVFRPEAVQFGLLLRRVVALARQFRDWNKEEVYMVAQSLTASIPGLAGHQAGAAVDFTLLDKESRQPLDMGNAYAEGSPICAIHCPYVTGEQFIARMKFYHVMRMGGFKLLPTENWHGSFGDRGLGIDDDTPTHAIYGPIVDFVRNTGNIIPYADKKKIDTYYLKKSCVDRLITLARKENADDKLVTELDAVEAFLTEQALQKSA